MFWLLATAVTATTAWNALSAVTATTACTTCSDLTEAGLNVRLGEFGCGVSMYPNCSSSVTYAEAVDHCPNMHVCTEEELELDVATGTGCGYDLRRIWTSTPCELGYVTRMGSTRWEDYPDHAPSPPIEPLCAQPHHEYPVRCCTNYTCAPTTSPTDSPTWSPTDSPTSTPTWWPSGGPTPSPTNSPSHSPTNSPSHSPTNSPSHSPTNSPSDSPTGPPPTVSPPEAYVSQEWREGRGLTPLPTSSPSDSFFVEEEEDVSESAWLPVVIILCLVAVSCLCVTWCLRTDSIKEDI